MRRTPLAWMNILHDKARSLVAILGVSFSLIVIFMQAGFFQSVLRTATTITDKLNYDLIIVSRNYLYLAESGDFPRIRLRQASAEHGVRRVSPIFIGTSSWRNPRRDPRVEAGEGELQRRPILLLGFDLSDRPFRSDGPFRAADVEERIDGLKAWDAVLIDMRSRGEYGPLEVGRRPEIGLKRYRIVGQFAMGTGFAADGAVIVGDQTYQRIRGTLGVLDRASLGLVELEPGADPGATAAAIAAALPSDVRVLTRAAYRFEEMRYWVVVKSIGVIFTVGVGVSFLVGLAVAYQVLSSDVADHVAEYATLRAMGYTTGRLSRIVMEQGLLIALAAYTPSLLISWSLYVYVKDRAVLPIDMNPTIAGGVLAAAAVMCSASAFASLRKVKAADPADLY